MSSCKKHKPQFEYDLMKANIWGLFLEIKSTKFDFKIGGTFNVDIYKLLNDLFSNLSVIKPHVYNPSKSHNKFMELSISKNEMSQPIFDINTPSFSLDNHSHYINSFYLMHLNQIHIKIIVGGFILSLLWLLYNSIIPSIYISIKNFISYMKSCPQPPRKRARTENTGFQFNSKDDLVRLPYEISHPIVNYSGNGDGGDDDNNGNNNRKDLLPGDKFIFKQITLLEIQLLIDVLKTLLNDLRSTRTLDDGTTQLNWNFPHYVVTRAHYWNNIFVGIFDPIISQFTECETTEHRAVHWGFARLRETYYWFLQNVFSHLANLKDVPSENLRFMDTGPPCRPWEREINVHPINSKTFEFWRPNYDDFHLVYDVNGVTSRDGIQYNETAVDYYNTQWWDNWVENFINVLEALRDGKITEENAPKKEPFWEYLKKNPKNYDDL